MPRSSASCDDSRTVTGRPAAAMLIAMPPPIVPQPTTPAAAIGRVGVSPGTSGIFATSRSAKKAWRCAADWSDSRSRSKTARSFFSASA